MLDAAAAEIGLDDGGIAGNLARRAAGDLAALVEHHDALGQRDDHLHDVLDDDERDPGAVDLPHQLGITPLLDRDMQTLSTGDVVLCRVGESEYLHIVKAVRGGQFQIGNNRGGINGWITRAAIYGRLVRVEP